MSVALLRSSMLALGLALSSPAMALDCPWTGTELSATAHWSHVEINGERHALKGSVNRGRFLSLLVACDATEAADLFTEWRDHHHAPTKYLFLSALLGNFGDGATCPWKKDDVVAYATMTKVYVDGEEYPVRGSANRGRFLSTLMACEELEAARHLDGWRASRQMTNWTAISIIGLVYTPVSAAGAGYFKNSLVRDLVQASESRSGGITGSG